MPKTPTTGTSRNPPTTAELACTRPVAISRDRSLADLRCSNAHTGKSARSLKK